MAKCFGLFVFLGQVRILNSPDYLGHLTSSEEKGEVQGELE
jgi:hypothetical protein